MNAGQPKASFIEAELTTRRGREGKGPVERLVLRMNEPGGAELRALSSCCLAHCLTQVIPPALGKAREDTDKLQALLPNLPFMETQSMENKSFPQHQCLKFSEEEFGAN